MLINILLFILTYKNKKAEKNPEMAKEMSKAPILFIVIGGAVIVVELIAMITISRKLKKIGKRNSERLYYNNNF